MSYDLHGIWDSTDPIGPQVLAHTNLTEIKLALDLFWRNKISPAKINLGLAFYGRSFQLKDPSCTKPGCPFKGPAPMGPCSLTAGVLTYSEIQDIRSKNYIPQEVFYDEEAAVKYLVYAGNLWVSYDDKTTWQQKIDYANEVGLKGLFIWAVDQDDISLSALKAVTGKDITPSPKQSSTLGFWEPSMCIITECSKPCSNGYSKMTSLSLDRTGKGCSDESARSLCCPPWSSPDPSTCQWRGTPSHCAGQCLPGEALLASDTDGSTGGHCVNNLRKAYCCPATGVQATIEQCHWIFASNTKGCPSNLPQEIGSAYSVVDEHGYAIPVVRRFCCPESPKFSNCKWHGDSRSCDNNRCPIVSKSHFRL